MGNQLYKDIEIEKDPYCQAGFGNLWKIHKGVKQDSSKRQVSIFIFDKKSIHTIIKKPYRDEVFAFLRREAQTLAKYKHPNIIGLVEPLAEDEKMMAFVTEYFETNLLSFVKKQQIYSNNNTNNPNLKILGSDLDIKLHMEELLKTLSFLHNDVHITHLGISPENIYCMPDGKWKLGGFIFSTQILTNNLTNCANVDFSIKPTDVFYRCYPNLNFAAPEIVDMQSRCIFASDVFSLGMLISMIFKWKQDYQNGCSAGNDIFLFNAETKSEYQVNLNDLKYKLNSARHIQMMTEDCKLLIYKLLEVDYQKRPTIKEIIYSDWLNDPFVKAVKYLDGIMELDQQQQVNFLRGVSKILFKFDVAVLKSRVLPLLLNLKQIEYLLPHLLQILIEILQKDGIISLVEYKQQIWPTIQYIISGKEMPAQALFLLIQNIPTFYKWSDKECIQQSFMPLVVKCFECKVPQLQDLALGQSEFLVQKVDYTITKNQLMPRVLTLCQTQNMEMRKKAVQCLSKIYTFLDKTVINEQVLVALEKIRKMGTDTQLTKDLLIIYQGIAKQMNMDTIANRLLPSLIPYLIDQNLNQTDFTCYVQTVRALILQIEDERLKNYAEIAKQQEQIPKQEEEKGQLSSMPAKTIEHLENDFDFLAILEQKQEAGQPDQITQQQQPKQPNTQNIKASSNAQQQQQQQLFSQFTGFEDQKSQQSTQGQGQKQQTTNSNSNFPFSNTSQSKQQQQQQPQQQEKSGQNIVQSVLQSKNSSNLQQNQKDNFNPDDFFKSVLDDKPKVISSVPQKKLDLNKSKSQTQQAQTATTASTLPKTNNQQNNNNNNTNFNQQQQQKSSFTPELQNQNSFNLTKKDSESSSTEKEGITKFFNQQNNNNNLQKQQQQQQTQQISNFQGNFNIQSQQQQQTTSPINQFPEIIANAWTAQNILLNNNNEGDKYWQFQDAQDANITNNTATNQNTGGWNNIQDDFLNIQNSPPASQNQYINKQSQQQTIPQPQQQQPSFFDQPSQNNNQQNQPFFQDLGFKQAQPFNADEFFKQFNTGSNNNNNNKNQQKNNQFF